MPSGRHQFGSVRVKRYSTWFPWSRQKPRFHGSHLALTMFACIALPTIYIGSWLSKLDETAFRNSRPAELVAVLSQGVQYAKSQPATLLDFIHFAIKPRNRTIARDRLMTEFTWTRHQVPAWQWYNVPKSPDGAEIFYRWDPCWRIWRVILTWQEPVS